MRLIGLVAFLVVAMGGGFPARGAEPVADPSPAELARQAARCRNLLLRSLVAFYLPKSVDVVHGGYLEDWADGEFARRNEKFLTMQARQLWFFSTLASENIQRDASIEAALFGYRFLERHFRDPRWGGYYSTVRDTGEPLDTRKHVYHNAFVIYALVAYHQASREAVPLRRAQELFQLLEQRAYDARNGGYIEFFHQDWRPVTDPSAAGYIGAIGTKTYNTHLHLLEAFAALYRVWPDPRLRMRIEELIRINTMTVRHPEYACNIDAWLPDWRMVDTRNNLRASYGHDIECVWLVLDAARSIGSPLPLYRTWAEALSGYSIAHGFDTEHGGFHYAGPLAEPADDTRKEWWVQAEALVGTLEMYRLTRNPQYYRIFARTLDFIERHQVAPDGGWWATRQADGSPAGSESRSSMWQGAYHSARALLWSQRILTNLNPAN